METITSDDGTTIAYERSGAGPALVLIGGALNTRRSVDGLVPLLSEHFTVYAFDRRGRGDSTDTSPHSVAKEVQDVLALIAAAGGSASVYGHSSGAILALETAAVSSGVAKLAVYEPPYLTGHGPKGYAAEFAARLQAALDEGRPGDAVEMFIRNTGAGFDDSIKQMPWWAGMTALAGTLPYDLALTGEGEVPARLSDVAVETLAVYGGASPEWARNSAEAVARVVPSATVEVVEGQTHAVPNEAIAPVLIDFFA